MKKRLVCLILSIAVVFSFSPLFTIQADAFSTGSKTLVKTRTVSIKPGKVYKTPYFKISKKMTFQVPIEIWLSKGDKGKLDYINKGGYKLILFNSKNKSCGSYSESLKYADRHEENWYSNWIYYYNKSIANPCYAKGKYYFKIKNTTNRIIKVKYSVKAYTKIATTGSFPTKKTFEQDVYYALGKIGPGIPVVKSVTCADDDVEVSWYVNHKGVLYVSLYSGPNIMETTLTVTLKNKGKKYKINTTIKGYEEDVEDPEE